MTERPETIDKKKVLEMYKSGMTQKEIRIELNVAKSTISGIVKQLKQNGNIKEK